MKGMIKIFVRYVGSAAAITLVLLALNIALLFFWLAEMQQEDGYAYRISRIADGLQKQEDGYVLSEAAQEAMNARYEWAMLLNDQGDILWSRHLPKALFKNYTVPEVASFTRWYLQDYPVYVWRHADGLLVMGCPKGSIWKMGMELPQNVMDKTLLWIPFGLAINGIAAVLLALLLGWRLFRSLRLLADGIERMAEKQRVELPKKGVLGDLAMQLNETSRQLQRQEADLQKRDYARTAWIAGVSHDIRTPLSMAMGYASQLEENSELPLSVREQVGIVRKQSERIKTLVNDLNLASKLEYDMQPIRKKGVPLAALLRSVCADFLNGGLCEHHIIDLAISEAAQNARILGDEELLRRSVANLIQNSVQHNPKGCAIWVALDKNLSYCEVVVSDNGIGFSEEFLKQMKKREEEKAHIPSRGLGLTIVRQIAKVHGGTADFTNLPEGGCEVRLRLPC
ncbi:HAMP domain-containing sensor histidine kinase [Desulforamulus ruminis]|uniref:sensor histidine kinase n=1 Tax=Desulforamulus ruminis TaxID=1564 RepID=UPI002FDA0C29